MAMCTGRLRYHGAGGISRDMFLVRHGASKPLAMFLPMIPPKTVRGKPTGMKSAKYEYIQHSIAMSAYA